MLLPNLQLHIQAWFFFNFTQFSSCSTFPLVVLKYTVGWGFRDNTDRDDFAPASVFVGHNYSDAAEFWHTFLSLLSAPTSLIYWTRGQLQPPVIFVPRMVGVLIDTALVTKKIGTGNVAVSLLTAERDAVVVEITALKVEKISLMQSN